eukprot:m.81680 g.81680  ORF g.81680 m.81680 type:complete len:473 (+) comp14701_c0_seq1:621-2039(+)
MAFMYAPPNSSLHHHRQQLQYLTAAAAQQQQQQQQQQQKQPSLMSTASGREGVDVGVLVELAKRVKRQLDPLVSVLLFVNSCLRWEVRLYSWILVLFLVLVCLSSVVLPIAVVVLVSAALVVSKTLEGRDGELQFDQAWTAAIKAWDAKNPEPANKLVERQLDDFYNLLCEARDALDLLEDYLDACQDTLQWKNQNHTIRWVAACFVLLGSCVLVPARIVFACFLLVVMAVNARTNTPTTNVPEAVDGSNSDETQLQASGTTPHDSMRMAALAKTKKSQADLSSWIASENQKMARRSRGRYRYLASELRLPEMATRQSSLSSFDDETFMFADAQQGSPDLSVLRKRSKTVSDVRAEKRAGRQSRSKKAVCGKCTGCSAQFNSIMRKRQYCRHCGNSFCGKCCKSKVPRSFFGATSPAAAKETVPVCETCFKQLCSRDESEALAPDTAAVVLEAAEASLPTDGTPPLAQPAVE